MQIRRFDKPRVNARFSEKVNKKGSCAMSDIVIISGSPSELSRSEKLLQYIGSTMRKEHYSVTFISIKDIPAEDLVQGNYESPVLQQITQHIQEASGVIVGSPVYKAAYSGVLKALFDLLPQDVLYDTYVLPIMTGGSPSHMLAMDYALKPLVSTMKGLPLKGLYYIDSQLDKHQENPIIDEEILDRTKKQLFYFLEKIGLKKSISNATIR